MLVQKIQDNNTNFRAQLTVNGLKLPKRFNQKVEKLVNEIGSDKDKYLMKLYGMLRRTL